MVSQNIYLTFGNMRNQHEYPTFLKLTFLDIIQYNYENCLLLLFPPLMCMIYITSSHYNSRRLLLVLSLPTALICMRMRFQQTMNHVKFKAN